MISVNQPNTHKVTISQSTNFGPYLREGKGNDQYTICPSKALLGLTVPGPTNSVLLRKEQHRYRILSLETPSLVRS